MDFTDLLNDDGAASSAIDIPSMVSQAASKYGIPAPVALAVAYHESGFNPQARSPVGAYGVMQLMPSTAKDLGADPADPAQNIDAGVRYLAQNIHRFGLQGGVAAYQAGPGAVARNGGMPVDASDGLSTNKQYVDAVLGIAQKKFGFQDAAQAATPEQQTSLVDPSLQQAMQQTSTDQKNTIGSLAKLGLGLEKGGLDVVQMVSSIVGPPGMDRYRLRDWAVDKKKEIDAELAQDPSARAAATDLQSAQGFWATLGALKDHPIDNVAVPVAEMVAPFLAALPAAEVGGAVGVGVAASRAGVAVGRMMGMTAQRAAQLGSAVGATLSASAEQGVQAGTTAYSDIKDKLVAGGMDPDQADREATDGAWQIGLATGLLMTGGAGRVAAKIATQGINALKQQTLKSAGANIAENAALGGATSVATTGVETMKEREVNPEADFSLGKTFAQGAVPGALVGMLGEGVTAVKQPFGIKPVDTSILDKINAAPDAQSAIDTFMGEVGKSRVDLGQGISLDSLSKLDAINKVADTDAMRNLMAQLSPDAQQQVQTHLNTALSADLSVTPEVRGQAVDALHQQLADSGTLTQAQQELNQQALRGTPEEQAAIQQASDLQQTPEWQQFAANQSDNARAAIDAAAKQAADATLHDTDRAGAAQRLLDLAGENQLGTDRPLEKQPTPEEPDQNPASTQLADARATLNDITQQPEWTAYLDGLKPAERSDVITKLGVVSNPKVSEGYRNAVAASLLQHAEDAGLHTPIPAITEEGLPGKPVPTEEAQSILATTKVNPEYGTIALVDPTKFTRNNLMAEGRGAVSAGQARVLQVFGRALGRTVHFFEQRDGTKQVDGFTHTDNPDVIFINREQSGAASLHAIFGHEFLHTMPDDIKKPFIDAAIKAIGPDKAEALRSYINQPELKSAGLHEEIGADLFGNGMNKPELIARALDQMPVSLATRVVNHVRQFIAKMANRLGMVKDFDTSKFVTDTKALDKAWVGAFREYLQRQQGGEAMLDGRPAHQFTPEELTGIADNAEHPLRETADLEIGRRSTYPDYEAVAALGKDVPKPALALPEKKELALPKTDLSAAQSALRQKRDAGVLLTQAELTLANGPDVKTPQIERRQKPRSAPVEAPIEVAGTRARPKPEKPATEPEKAVEPALTDEDKAAIQQELADELKPEEPALQYSGERPQIMAEVAPDPNNKELSARWDRLDADTKAAISDRVASRIIPKVLNRAMVRGKVEHQLGGYLGKTNPSMSIMLDERSTPQQIARAAKLAGHALSQDSMMVVSPKQVEGAEPVGVITVDLPKNPSPELVSDVYRRIYEIDGGALQGHTTSPDGQMALVDFSGNTKALAEKVNQKLGGEYQVRTHSAYSSFIPKESYGYEEGHPPSTGNAVPSGPSVRDAAHSLRAEASAALDQELTAHEGAGEEGLRASVGRSQINANWTSTDPTKLDNVLYNLQDKHIDTKRVLESIKQAAGAITDKINPYLKETLYHGRAAQQTKEFLSHEMRPLMQSMVASKITIPELNEYLHMRHAEERNRQIAGINPAFPDAASGVTTAEARKYLQSLPADRARVLEGLAKRVDAITKGTRELMVASGLETRDTINQWERTYQKYAPLNREGFDRVQGSGQGFSVRGSASKRATGSNRPVDDILANVAMARERTITRAEKNVVGNALFGLAVKNPNADFWLPVASAKDVTSQQKMLYDMGLDPQEVKNLVNEPTKPYINPHTGMVDYRINPLLRNMPNVLTTRVNGRDQYLIFNAENPRAERLVESMKNLDAPQMGAAMSAASSITRYVASVNTQYNPFFGVLNIMRDAGEAAINLSATPLAGRQAEVTGNIPAAVRGVMIALREERAGKAVTSTWGKLYQEFAEAGGKTGYRDMYMTSADRAKALQKEITDITAGKTKQIGRAALGLLDDFNESLENGTRLAVYKAARDHGMSIDQSAALAKELTVNFNRKGKISSQAGALYAFFNASVQGTATMARTLASPAGRKIIAGGLLLGAANAVLMHATGIDKDIPEFVKQNNLIIPTGGKGYIAIPMPLGYRIIPGVGRMLTELALNGGRGKAEMAANMLGLAADSFNPIGNAGLSVQTIAPTFADPLVALAENKDWTGRPIAKQDFDSLHPTPGFTRSFSNASDFGKVVAQVVNTLTGGSQYRPGLLSPTPDQIDYLTGQVTGGIGREAVKAEGAARAAINGEEVQLHKIPLVGRFVGTTSDQSGVSSRFYDNLRQVNELQYEAKERLKNRDGYREFLQENPEIRLAQSAGRAQRTVSSLKKMKQQLIDAGASRERIYAVDQQINAVMTRLNESLASLQD